MKKIIFIIISLIVYFILIFIYNNIYNNNYSYVYVLNKNVLRNNKVNKEDFIKIKIKEEHNIDYVKNINENYVYSNNYDKSMILTKDMINDGYKESFKNELVSIKIKSIEDIVSYKVSKNNYVSIYFTCKLKSIEDNLSIIESDKFITSKDGYITFKLFDKIKIIEICDEEGNIIVDKNKKIDTIIIDVEKIDVLKINALKNIGEFSLSLIG